MRRVAATLLAIGVCTALVWSVAYSITYPTGLVGSLPGGPCPDTLGITNVQDPTATCHPSPGTPGDSLLGIKGRVIGLDKDFGPFALYVQEAGGGPYSGIQVFTFSGNYATGGIAHGGVNIGLGDDVAIYGDYEEFANRSEIVPVTASQPTNFYKLVRRISAANPSPPYHIGNTTELNWIPAISAATAEQWEGTLVRVNGPLKVKRNGPGGSTGAGLGSRSFLVVNGDGSNPGDSLCIDGFELTNIPVPALDATIDMVQGVFTQTSIGGLGSYRILLRDTDDLQGEIPPSMTDAFMISDTQVRVRYDRAVTSATGEEPLNYTFASGSSATAAAFESGSAQKVVIVTTDNSANYAHGTSETITATNIRGEAGNLLQSTPQSRTYAFGVMSIEEIQRPDPARLMGSPCADGSRFTAAGGFTGTRVSLRGVITGVHGITYSMQDALSATRNGLTLFRPNETLTVGHRYLFAGQIQEFDGTSGSVPGGETEAVNKVYLADEGNVGVPAPVVQTVGVLNDETCDATQTLTTAEDYEGMLVKVANVRVSQILTPDGPGANFVVGSPPELPGPPTEEILILNQNNAYSFDPTLNDVVDVTGVLVDNPTTTSGFRYRIVPRNDADIVRYGTLPVGPGPAIDALSLSVSPNPSRSARVTFALPRAGDVELAVYDLSGRKLATLANGRMPAGQYSRSWDGADATGKAARAGMYFYKLKLDGELVSTKAVKLD